TAVRHGAVLAFELLGTDEMHRGLIRLEVMGHGDDLPADLIGVGALGEYDITLAGVLLAGFQVRASSTARRGNGIVGRDSVLDARRHSGHVSQRFGMSLTDA